MRTFIQFSSGRGPTECCLVVEKVFKEFYTWLSKTYKPKECDVCVIDSKEETNGYGFLSLTCEILHANEDIMNDIRKEWEGTIKWIATKNSIRPNHKRKNWFINVSFFNDVEFIQFEGKDLKWETMRSSGPGGQHCNVTESGVRVTHLPTGISVHCQEERNQLRNKEIAIILLQMKINEANKERQLQNQKEAWNNHNNLVRGNEIKTFKGEI